MNEVIHKRKRIPCQTEEVTRTKSDVDKYNEYNTLFIDNTNKKDALSVLIPPGYFALIMFYEQNNITITQGIMEKSASEKETSEPTSNKPEPGEVLIMDRLQEDVAVIKNDIGHLRENVNELKSDIKIISTEKLPAIQTDTAVIKEKVGNISDRLDDISSWFKGLVITIIGGIIVGLILYYIKTGA